MDRPGRTTTRFRREARHWLTCAAWAPRAAASNSRRPLRSANRLARISNRNSAFARLRLPIPLGIEVTDRFFAQLEELSGKPTPAHHAAERGRLVDAYVDAHKYAAGKRVALFGDEDLMVSLCSFLVEIGMEPVLCASGGNSGRLREALATLPAHTAEMLVMSDTDFATIEPLVGELKPDLLIGSSKGYAMSRSLGIPLLRVGFPIHDRIGGSRQMHVGYRGTQQLFDRIVNQLIAARQDENSVGYMNM